MMQNNEAYHELGLNVNYTQVSNRQLLTLVLYIIELEYHFTGDGVWNESHVQPVSLSLARTQNMKTLFFRWKTSTTCSQTSLKAIRRSINNQWLQLLQILIASIFFKSSKSKTKHSCFNSFCNCK